MRHITENGLRLIKKFEGFSDKIYLDSAGFQTIGHGHLILPQEQQLYQNGITEANAESLLKHDVTAAEKAVTSLINVPFTNHQFDSLVSFTFNLGAGALQRSALRRKVNREEHTEVPAEFLRWVYAGSKKMPGLVRRRKAEAVLYSEN